MDAETCLTGQKFLAGEAVRKYRTGEPIEDEELAAGIAVIANVISSLCQMGERYKLVTSDLSMILTQFEGFRESRERDKGKGERSEHAD